MNSQKTLVENNIELKDECNLEVFCANVSRYIRINYGNVDSFLEKHNFPKTQIYTLLKNPEKANPRFNTLKRIAAGIGVPMSQLFNNGFSDG